MCYCNVFFAVNVTLSLAKCEMAISLAFISFPIVYKYSQQFAYSKQGRAHPHTENTESDFPFMLFCVIPSCWACSHIKSRYRCYRIVWHSIFFSRQHHHGSIRFTRFQCGKQNFFRSLSTRVCHDVRIRILVSKSYFPLNNLIAPLTYE